MTAGVQLTGMIQPSPDMIYDAVYEEGEIILPLEAGRWTLFAIQPVFTKDDKSLPIVRNYSPGHASPTTVQVTWLAADQEAYSHTIQKYREQQAALQRAQAVQAAKPKLLVPGA